MSRSRNSGSRGDAAARMQKGNRILVGAILVLAVFALTAVLYALAANLVARTNPRTYLERQVDMLQSVVQQKPKVSEAWADYILALVATKQYSRADTALKQADKALGPNVIDIVYVRARLAGARGDTKDALKLCDQAIADGLKFREAELARMFKLGATPDPHTIKGPILASAYYYKATLLAEQKKWPEAIAAASKALEEEPNSADALVFRGSLYLETGDKKAATADFKKALEFIPDFQPALDGLKRAGKDAS